MSEEVTIEIDDIHELMFTEMADEFEEDVTLEEWAEDTITGLIYQQYKSR